MSTLVGAFIVFRHPPNIAQRDVYVYAACGQLHDYHVFQRVIHFSLALHPVSYIITDY